MHFTEKATTVEATSARNTDPMYWERLLAAEGLSVETSSGVSTLEAEGLLWKPEDGQVLYLGLPAGSGSERFGTEVADESALSEIEELSSNDEQEARDESTPAGPTCPVLLPEDFELIETIRRRGYAVSLHELYEEIGACAQNAVKLIEAGWAMGEARGREDSQEPIFVLTSATDEDVLKAANRAQADRLRLGFESKVEQCSKVATLITERLSRLGGAVSEAGTVNAAILSGHSRPVVKRVIREIVGRGAVRRLARSGSESSRHEEVFLALPDTTGADLRSAAARLRSVEAASSINRKHPAKTFAREASVYTRPEERPVELRDLDLAGQTFRFQAARAGGGRLCKKQQPTSPAQVARNVLATLQRGGPASWRSIAASHEDPVAMEQVMRRLEEMGLVTKSESSRHGSLYCSTKPAAPTPGATIPKRMSRILAARRRRRERIRRMVQNADPERVALDSARALALATGSAAARALITLTRSESPIPLGEIGVEREVLASLARPGLLVGSRRRSDDAQFVRITAKGAKSTYRALARIVADSNNAIPAPLSGPLAGIVEELRVRDAA